MSRDEAMRLGRRRVLLGLGAAGLAVGGGALLAGGAQQLAPYVGWSRSAQPETKTVRLQHGFATCISPLFLSGDLLRADGFDVNHVPSPLDVVPLVSAGGLDFGMQTAANTTVGADTLNGFVHLAGIRTMSDLRGKRVAVNEDGSGAHLHMAMMAAHVGVNLTLVTGSSTDAIADFEAGQIDGFMAFPPEPRMFREKGIGHVLVKTHIDKPWSQYFCCMLIANRAFVQNNPVATKQVVRAVLLATDLCANDPAEATRRPIDRGDVTDRDATFQMLKNDVAYDRWREYDPEDSIRFYALLLQQIGMVKSTPDQLIAQSTDWRILNELKQELKT
jgi:NitT/TauT family transport system substrate-binding protein